MSKESVVRDSTQIYSHSFYLFFFFVPGSELTDELPHYRHVPKIITSRHVTKTHSMKAINTCKLRTKRYKWHFCTDLLCCAHSKNLRLKNSFGCRKLNKRLEQMGGGGEIWVPYSSWRSDRQFFSLCKRKKRHSFLRTLTAKHKGSTRYMIWWVKHVQTPTAENYF